MIPCPSYPGYMVDEFGNVRSHRRRKAPFILRQTTVTKGYKMVSVTIGRQHRALGVHQLVADAFYGPRPFREAQVRHLEGDPANNKPKNLAWGTATENAADRKLHGRYAFGSRHPNAKLSEIQARGIYKKRTLGESVRSLALRYGVSTSCVESIIYGKLWKGVIDFKKLPKETT